MKLNNKNREWYAKLGLELEETGPFYLKVKDAKDWYIVYCSFDYVAAKEEKKSFYSIKPLCGSKEIYVNESFAFEINNASTGGMPVLIFKGMEKDIAELNKIADHQNSYDFRKLEPDINDGVRIEYLKSK